MKKVKIVEQMEHSECGLACITMILNYYGNNIKLSKLREEYGVPVGGYTLIKLKQILEEKGIESTGVYIKDIELLDKSFFPFIAFWERKHFVVIEKIKHNKVLIEDPALGRRWVKRDEFNEKFSKSALLCEVTEDFEKNKQKNEYNHLTSFFYSHKNFIFSLLLMTLLIQALSISIPMTIQNTIDKLLESSHINFNILFITGILLVGTYYIINVIRTLTINKFQIIFDDTLMSLVFKHLLRLPYSFFINRSPGELIFRMNSNLYIRQILSDKIISVVIDSLLFFVYLGIMLMYSKELTLVICIIGILLVTVSIYNGKKVREINEKEIIHTGKIQTNLNESMNGIITIKSTGSENQMFDNWKVNFDEQLKCMREKGKWNAFLSNIPISIQVFIPVVVFLYGSYFIEKGQITVGSLIAFNTIASSFIIPLISLSSSYSDILVLKIYLNKLYDILDTELEENKQEKVEIKEGNIKVENLNFKYNKLDKNIIKNINLEIASGEKVAIVGKSGSGKSTLAKLIMGLFESSEGSVRVDGLDISNVDIQNYRSQLGIVLQEPQIFNGSLKDNILFGREHDCEKMTKAIDISNIRIMINSMPMGIDTIVSEDGVNFSGGQRQRIALARAVYNSPKIIIMDEPTSSLDNESEKEVINNIFKLDSTCIVISHRFYNIERFDKIIVVNEGEVKDIGSHEELIRRCDTYKNMYGINEEKIYSII
ncbi:peptidase domain-containing ABC transporter [Paraclostridium sordellii]|uniref:peptidase domain-containing ABC transporter n=1 Tax=Paraclostridium sordellii TaxID=1505 RepID=UPI001C616184|nr:peptidase domain-containing ABC transporter [Paeniclostridium sordellii]QYE99795.1 peptidase domain-containing ABC transporter [Paeniclostridium sordellii]